MGELSNLSYKLLAILIKIKKWLNNFSIYSWYLSLSVRKVNIFIFQQKF